MTNRDYKSCCSPGLSCPSCPDDVCGEDADCGRELGRKVWMACRYPSYLDWYPSQGSDDVCGEDADCECKECLRMKGREARGQMGDGERDYEDSLRAEGHLG